jgi:hypothetical protein
MIDIVDDQNSINVNDQTAGGDSNCQLSNVNDSSSFGIVRLSQTRVVERVKTFSTISEQDLLELQVNNNVPNVTNSSKTMGAHSRKKSERTEVLKILSLDCRRKKSRSPDIEKSWEVQKQMDETPEIRDRRLLACRSTQDFITGLPQLKKSRSPDNDKSREVQKQMDETPEIRNRRLLDNAARRRDYHKQAKSKDPNVETPEMRKQQRRLKDNGRRKTKYHMEAKSSDHKDGTAAMQERWFLDNERRRTKDNNFDKVDRTEKWKKEKNQNEGSPDKEKQKQENNDRRREASNIKQICNIDLDNYWSEYNEKTRFIACAMFGIENSQTDSTLLADSKDLVEQCGIREDYETSKFVMNARRRSIFYVFIEKVKKHFDFGLIKELNLICASCLCWHKYGLEKETKHTGLCVWFQSSIELTHTELTQSSPHWPGSKTNHVYKNIELERPNDVLDWQNEDAVVELPFIELTDEEELEINEQNDDRVESGQRAFN